MGIDAWIKTCFNCSLVGGSTTSAVVVAATSASADEDEKDWDITRLDSFLVTCCLDPVNAVRADELDLFLHPPFITLFVARFAPGLFVIVIADRECPEEIIETEELS